MKIYFSKSGIKIFALCLFLICPIVQTISAFELSQAEILTKEKKAEQLGEQWSGEPIHRSIVLFLETAADWEKIGETQKAADALREAAKLAQNVSDYQTAFASLDKAVKLDKKINNINGQVISLSLLSLIYQQKGETLKCESYAKQAVSLSENSTDELAKAYAFLSGGIYNFYYGDIKTTTEQLEKASDFAGKTGDKKLNAQILRELAAAYIRDGNSEKGLETAKKSLEISIESQNKREQAFSNFYLGMQYLLIDKKQISLDYFKTAEINFPDDADQLHKARIVNALAYIYTQYGELEITEKYYEDAENLFQQAEYPTGVLATLPYLANVKRLNGKAEESRLIYDKAMKLAVKLKDEFHIGLIKEGFADSFLADTNYDSAIKNYRAALAVNKKIGIELPRVQNSLGKAFELKGDLASAEENYQTALARNLKIQDFSSASENLYNLANLSVAQGNFDKALEYSNKSIEFTESTYTNVDNNKLRRTFLSTIYDRYAQNIFLLMKMHERFPNDGYALKALQTSEKSRARLLLENLRLSEAEFTADADPQTVEKEKQIRGALNEKAEKLTQVLTSGAAKDEIKETEDEISELKNELEKINGELKSKSPFYANIKNPPDFDLREFQQNALDDESTFLEFSFGENESYLWLIEKNDFAVARLPKREILENGLDEIYELLSSRELLEDESVEDYGRRIAENEQKFQNRAQTLSDQLFGKFAVRLKNKRLIVAADGKLRYFPVSAFPFPNAAENLQTGEPLLLTNEIINEPSAAILNLLARKSNHAKTPEKNLLIFADPVYSPQDERLTSTLNANAQTDLKRNLTEDLSLTSSLGRLPATEQEAASIVETFGTSKADLFTGFSASRENFFQSDLSDYKILHFAAHGLLNEDFPEFSGLIFSKFDETGKSKKGIVRLQDIYGLNLRSDLVVLSACDTGIGKDIKGEGLISLTDGFLQAGARTVVSSRWKVSDRATLGLMKNFYEIMESENIPPSEALQKAKIKLRSNPAFASPFYWAAFTIQGDYQTKPNFSSGYGFSKYFLIPISILVLLGIYFGVKKFR